MFKLNDELKTMLNMASANKRITVHIENNNIFLRKQRRTPFTSSNAKQYNSN